MKNFHPHGKSATAGAAPAAPAASAAPDAPVNPQQSLLYTEGLTKYYKKRRVVSSVNLRIEAGEIVGLLGPNGAGKTTSFYMIMGLIIPSGGRVSFQGREISRLPMYRRARLGMGYLSQEPSIFRSLTVEENLMAILETLPLKKAQRLERMHQLLDEMKISHLAGNYAYTLSGGERRRLEIARSLITRPKLLLLDEPFSGVDPIAVFDVQQIIRSLKKMGIGILLTDHSVRETLRITDRTYLMYEGRILKEGSSEFLANDPEARHIYLGKEFTM